MKIALLWRESLNPESVFKIENHEITGENSAFVPNPFDEFALESILRSSVPSDSIHLVGWGSDRCKNLLRHGLALGAGNASVFFSSEFRALGKNEIEELTSWIKREEIEAVVLGAQHPDWDETYLAAQIAGRLKWRLCSETSELEQESKGFDELYRSSVVPVTRGKFPVRRPDLKSMMAARKKEIHSVEHSETRVESWQCLSSEPFVKRSDRQIWNWESEETGKEIARRLITDRSWGVNL